MDGIQIYRPRYSVFPRLWKFISLRRYWPTVALALAKTVAPVFSCTKAIVCVNDIRNSATKVILSQKDASITVLETYESSRKTNLSDFIADEEVKRRFQEGERVVVALHRNMVVAYKWMRFAPYYMKEVDLAAIPTDRQFIIYDSFIQEKWRGGNISFAITSFILEWARAHGYETALLYLVTRKFQNIGNAKEEGYQGFQTIRRVRIGKQTYWWFSRKKRSLQVLFTKDYKDYGSPQTLCPKKERERRQPSPASAPTVKQMKINDIVRKLRRSLVMRGVLRTALRATMKLVEPVFIAREVIFVVSDLRKPIRKVVTKKHVDLRVIEDYESCKKTDLSRFFDDEELMRRFGRGEVVGVALDGGTVVSYNWFNFHHHFCQQLQLTILFKPLQFATYDGFTLKHWRGQNIWPAIFSTMQEWAKARGFEAFFGWILVSNKSSISSTVKPGFEQLSQIRLIRILKQRIWWFGPTRLDMQLDFAADNITE